MLTQLFQIGGRYSPAQSAVMGRVSFALTNAWHAQVQGQTGGPDGQAVCVLETDLHNMDNHMTARFQTNDGSLRLTYTQHITRRMAAGLSMLYSHVQLGAGAGAVASWMHKNGWTAVSLTMMPSQQAVSVHHWRPWLFGINFATEFQFAQKMVAPDEPPRWSTQFAVGWEYHTPQPQRRGPAEVLVLKQSITSAGQVASFISQQLAPHIEAELSVQLDHKKGAFTMGAGLQWQF